MTYQKYINNSNKNKEINYFLNSHYILTLNDKN